MQFNSIETYDPIVERLRKLAHERPDLNEAARLYGAILPLLRDAELRVVPVSIASEEARSKLEKGLPILPGLDLELDEQAVCDLMLELARSIESTGVLQYPHKFDTTRCSKGTGMKNDSLLPGGPGRIRLAIEDNKADVGSLLLHIIKGERGFVEAEARDLQLDPALLWFVSQNALKPALHVWRRQLAPLAEEIPWDRGYCFICGADATLGELRENGQVMHLRCGQCGADWRLRRLRCIWCGNEDHGTLSCLYSEDQREKMRVEACDRCRNYLKVITSFSPLSPEMLPVEDLATLHLDYIAREHGYDRGGIIKDDK
jgi:FdhE protein